MNMISITSKFPILASNFHAKIKINKIGNKKLMAIGISKQFLHI